jgi:hypothetical protein
VAEGNREEMLAACYAAWKADVEAGKSSLMLAVDNATVAELNRLARPSGSLPARWPSRAWPYPMGR